MLNLTLAGNVGRDAEKKTTQSGQELCSFPVAVSVGYGENKSTVWVDVTKWGKGSDGLSRILRKGSKVAVSGELSTREHNGKTYLQCRADNVTILGGAGDAPRRPADPNNQAMRKEFAPQHDDLNDDLPPF